MGITFDDRFICLITATKEYLNLIRKLEEAFDGIVLENMYKYPQYILDLLEEESNVNWTEEIWDLIYNGSEKDTKQALYEIKKLQLINDPFEEAGVKEYKQKILDLLLEKGMLVYEAIELVENKITEWNIFDYKTEYANDELLADALLTNNNNM